MLKLAKENFRKDLLGISSFLCGIIFVSAGSISLLKSWFIGIANFIDTLEFKYIFWNENGSGFILCLLGVALITFAFKKPKSN